MELPSQIMEENDTDMCIEHGYSYPCPVCDGESDS